MHKRSRARQLIVLTFLAAYSAMAVAATGQELESGLVKTLRLKKGTDDRVDTPGKALRAYKREGFINKKPNQRADYTDYYLVNKPTTLMGHELVVIEEEYKTEHIGCCVSPGVGVTVKVDKSAKNLEKFASANKCKFTDKVDVNGELSSVGVKSDLPKEHYASLSCRLREAQTL